MMSPTVSRATGTMMRAPTAAVSDPAIIAALMRAAAYDRDALECI